MADKKADLAGPGISTYPEVDKILPGNYSSILNRKDTQKAIYAIKDYIEKNLYDGSGTAYSNQRKRTE
jgi:aspartate--ammonia ligase